MNILIVDDGVGIKLTLAAILEDEGYTVSLASTGVEAVEHFKNNPADFVVMDIKMPEMDGIEALGLMNKISSNLNAVIVTASTKDHGTIEVSKGCEVKVFRKPVDIDLLLEHIKGLELRTTKTP